MLRVRTVLLLCVLFLIVLSESVVALMIPGMALIARRSKEIVRVEVSGLHSSTNLIQYDYYDSALPFEERDEKAPFRKSHESENLGFSALLSGEQFHWSPYAVPFLQSRCFFIKSGKMGITEKEKQKLITLINRNYRVQMEVDDVPIRNDGGEALNGHCRASAKKKMQTTSNFLRGYYLGVPKTCDGETYLNNHLHFHFEYFQVPPEDYQYYEEETLTDGSEVMRKKKPTSKKSKGQREPEADADELEPLYIITKVSVRPFSIHWPEVNEYGAPPNCAVHAEDRDTIDGMDDELNHVNNKYTLQHADDDDVDDDGNDPQDDDKNKNAGGDEATEENTNPLNWLGRNDQEDEEEGDNKPEAKDKEEEEAEDAEDELDDAENTREFNIVAYTPTHYPPLKLQHAVGKKIAWTYTVDWEKSPGGRWSTRWDMYMKQSDAFINRKTHFTSILFATVFFFLLFSTISAVLFRALRKDLLRANVVFELSKEEEEQAMLEEKGWKAVGDEVFRPPQNALFLVVGVASGVEVLLASSLMLLIMLFGAPMRHGGSSTMTRTIQSTTISALAGGIVCMWFARQFRIPKAWAVVLLFAFALSAAVFATFALSNLILSLYGSSRALSLFSMFVMAVNCFVVFPPFALAGGYIGSKLHCIPLRYANTPPRAIVDARIPTAIKPRIALLYTGLLPFIVAFLELRLMFSCLWGGSVYYFFGSLTVIFFLWTLICSLVSVCTVYYNLSFENYEWQWLSFAAPSSMGAHVLLYIVYYLIMEVHVSSFGGVFLYLSYTLLIALFYVLGSGAIGFISTWMFTRFIYSSVKSD